MNVAVNEVAILHHQKQYAMLPLVQKQAFKKIAFIILFLLCATPFINAPIALALGFLFSCFIGHPFAHLNHKATNWLLKIAVVGLGFGMNFYSAMLVGEKGLRLTFFSICSIIILGIILGKILKINPKTTHLVSSGTAICGGSAIAAIAPVVEASEKDMSVALGTVFALNSIALILFPIIGHSLSLSQYQFGLWSAIAIQDTSSVVGAASAYGKEALGIATTVKLARALWIIPVALISILVFKSKNKKVTIPWFIGLFILAMLCNTFLSIPVIITHGIRKASESVLVVTLFLIGAGLSVEKIKAVGWKPLALGIALWAFISVSSLFVIIHL